MSSSSTPLSDPATRASGGASAAASADALEADRVALSCRLVAAERAWESRRPDGQRLFHDPMAELLAGSRAMQQVRETTEARVKEATAATPAQPDAQMMSPGLYLPLRTRYLDDWLQRLSRAPDTAVALDQFVLLGAGMDSRVFRMSCFAERSGSAEVFELDQPEVLRVKQSLIDEAIAKGACKPPLCKRVPVECDFAVSLPEEQAKHGEQQGQGEVSSGRHWTQSLLDAGFDRQRASCWLVEGLLMYLSESDQLRLLTHVSQHAAAGSQMALDHVSERFLQATSRDPALLSAPVYRDLQPTWRSFLSPSVMQLLAREGWHVHLTQPGAPDASYDGRWRAPVLPMADDSQGPAVFLTATKIAGGGAEEQKST